ncbi:DUF1214 domain-containing protein [Lutimaribacter marinistellae]|uniref:DUF1214 domain-containing protein n=1 Tax=Lutimaribacter marinistellae TaxID=1820329 RepID=A0ABV7TKD8_9RHOB
MKHFTLSLALAACLTLPAGVSAQSGETLDLTEAQMEELVRRSYQYVAMFNVNQKGALDPDNPQNTGGYNRVKPNTELADHTLRVIARPNNDTLYTVAMIDVTEEPVVLEIPAFDSTYVSLMVTAYDHYVNIPMSTTKGDFDEPANILFFSERTPGYAGEPVEGVDMIVETTGDFVSAVFRIMPHAAEPERLERNLAAMRSVDVEPLSEFLGQGGDKAHVRSWGSPRVVGRNLDLRADTARFPPYGSDFEIFEDRFIEVMQFVANHTTFDPNDALDAGLLAVLEPLGIQPGKPFDPDTAPEIDGDELRAVAQRVATEELAKFGDQDFLDNNLTGLFQPKGQISLERQVFQSVSGPIGQPADQALYPAILTEDGVPMNAMHDYEIVMTAEEMPPVNAFWSATLYENETGFFIPNDRFKYSVGENAGFKLDDDGGIRIVIAAEQPEGVPEENWLPINLEDMDLDIIMRLYAPDLERYESWSAPIARKLN